MEDNLLTLLVANWSALQSCLTIKGKMEEVQYLLFGLRESYKFPENAVRDIVLKNHLFGYIIALFSVILLTGGILVAMGYFLVTDNSAIFFKMVGMIYIVAAIVTFIFQFLEFKKVSKLCQPRAVNGARCTPYRASD